MANKNLLEQQPQPLDLSDEKSVFLRSAGVSKTLIIIAWSELPVGNPRHENRQAIFENGEQLLEQAYARAFGFKTSGSHPIGSDTKGWRDLSKWVVP